jgi:DNA-binding transcriptional LysR family regulator
MIDLRHLRCFVAVAEELSFRRAAERVHVDQSPLSRTIRDLESDLGILLFARTPRTLRMTPAGELLLQEARELFVRLECAKRRVRETDARYRAPLRLGIADGLAQPRLLECLARWRHVAPHTPLEITDMRAPDLADALRGEELDVGISFGVPNEEAIVQELAWSYAAAALLHVEHELASRATLTISEVSVYPMIAYHPKHQPGLRRQLDAMVPRHSPPLAGQASSLTGLMNQVSAGIGVGLIDVGHLDLFCRANLIVVPLRDDAASITTYLLHKRQRSQLPIALEGFFTHAKSLK